MSKEITMVNVLIKDGNRTVSWVHPITESVGHVLKSHEFKPVENSVFINMKQAVGNLNVLKLSDCGTMVYKQISRVFIILKSQTEEVKKADDSKADQTDEA